MGECSLYEHVATGTCSRCERELERLKAVDVAAHKALAILSARATVALPPSAMMLAYKLAFDELRDGMQRSTQATRGK